MDNQRRFPIGRIIAGVIAVFCVVMSFLFFLAYLDCNRRFHKAVEAEPVSLQVDLSKPGKYRASFDQSFSNSHGEMLYLELKLDEVETKSAKGLLDGLSATLKITDDQGEEAISAEILNRDVSDEVLEIPVKLFYFSPFRMGKYIMELEVHSGAPKLSGLEQRLYAKYMLCGLERAPAKIAGILSIVALILAFIITAIIFFHHSQEAPSGKTKTMA